MATRLPQCPPKRAASIAARHISVPGGFVADQLGEELKALFDRVAEEPLPDHLMRLADELERRCEDRSIGAGRRGPRLV